MRMSRYSYQPLLRSNSGMEPQRALARKQTQSGLKLSSRVLSAFYLSRKRMRGPLAKYAQQWKLSASQSGPMTS